MSESVGNAGGVPAPWLNPADAERAGAASVLLVEDDDDIRELIVTLLELAGVDVTACAHAEGGLEELRETPFDMVLTDYMLPHRTGAWLLEQASHEGLLEAVPVLVVSAHPNPPVNGFEVLPKPFDLDDLVDKVRERLGMSSRRSELPLSVRTIGTRGGDGDGGAPNGKAPIELVLYVSAHSPHSAAALENIRRVVARFAPERIRLTVCDLSVDPSQGIVDSVAFTPTLVKRSPGPRTFILGHLADPERLTELLDGCGEEVIAVKPHPPTN